MTEDDPETRLRLDLMAVQIAKARFDMDIESRKYRLQTAALLVSILALVVAAYAAGHFIH